MRLPGFNGGMGLGTGLALGAAAVLLAPVLMPVIAGVAKSLAKAGIKGGMVLYEQGKIAAEEAKETIEDLAAKARSELSQESEARAPASVKKGKSTAGC